MKATWFAVLLSLFVVSFAAQAVEMNTPSPALSVKQKINLNKADVQILAHSCKGIGKKRAEAIVSYRETHGGFKSVEELSQVHGIGKQFVRRHLTQLQAMFTVG